VLENLLDNAWKFSSKGTDTRIEFGQLANEESTIFFVKDNGAGFDMNYADKLFGAFQRLHDESEFHGTGIGLATVQRIVHRHGGRIWVESNIGHGSTFYFILGSHSNSSVLSDHSALNHPTMVAEEHAVGDIL